jgi:hypothetical protein
MSSRFLEIASWSGVSPSISYKGFKGLAHAKIKIQIQNELPIYNTYYRKAAL